MARSSTKVEDLAEVVRVRQEQGEKYGEIASSYGLRKKQLKQLMERQRRKERKISAGYIPRPQGRPRKEPASEEVKRNNEIVQLRMQVELLRNFLSEAGRR